MVSSEAFLFVLNALVLCLGLETLVLRLYTSVVSLSFVTQVRSTLSNCSFDIRI